MDYESLSNCANANLKGKSRVTFEQYVQSYYLDLVLFEANKLLNQLIESVDENTFATFYQPRIVQITDRHLGKGNKIANLNRDQSEVLSLVVDDLRELIKLKP